LALVSVLTTISPYVNNALSTPYVRGTNPTRD
jgi:hypothetical protein